MNSKKGEKKPEKKVEPKKDQEEEFEHTYLPVNIKLTELTCPCCQEIMIEPVLYPCAHRVCKECTKHILFDMSSTNRSKCPICRVPITEQVLSNVDIFMAEIAKQAPIQVPCGKVMSTNEYTEHMKSCNTCCYEAFKKLQKEQEYERGRAKSTSLSNNMALRFPDDNTANLMRIVFGF